MCIQNCPAYLYQLTFCSILFSALVSLNLIHVIQCFTGTLHFANIKTSDVTPDGKFICNMHNFIYRTYSVGEDKKINVSTSELTLELVTTIFMYYKSHFWVISFFYFLFFLLLYFLAIL